MKIFKLTNAELRKIFLRPTIFIMIALLLMVSVILILVFPFKEENTNYVEITGNSVGTIYNNFIDSSSTNNSSKKVLDAKFEETKTKVNSFKSADNSISETNDILIDIETTYTLLKTSLELALNPDTFNRSEIDTQLATYSSKLNDLSAKYKTSFNESKRFYVKSKNYSQTVELLNSYTVLVDGYYQTTQNSPDLQNTYYVNAQKTLRNFDFLSKFNELFSEIKKISINNAKIGSIVSCYYSNSFSKLNQIFLKIQSYNTLNSEKTQAENRNTILKYIGEYKSFIEMNIKNLEYSLLIELSDNKIDSEMQSYNGFPEFNRMKYKSIITKNDYLITNNKFAVDYLNTLSESESTSDFASNAYDFSAYALNILAILITLFSIIIVSKIVAGEQSTGSMKLLAIRPYSRNKILFSKLLATCFFAFIFLIFALIVNFLIGLFVFGVPSNIMMIGIFNGSSVFVAHPFIYLLLYTFSIFIKIIAYISLAIFISVLFKSYTGATIVSFLAYIVSIILNITVKSSGWYKFFPTSNFDLYKYFLGGENINSFMQYLSSTLVADTTFFFSLFYLIYYLLIINFISFLVFNKKDIA